MSESSDREMEHRQWRPELGRWVYPDEPDYEREAEVSERHCPKCGGTDPRTSTSGRLTCRDCEKRRGRERRDRRHRERGDRCGCGTDAVSLNPAEVVVHNWGGGPCRIAPVKREAGK